MPSCMRRRLIGSKQARLQSGRPKTGQPESKQRKSSAASACLMGSIRPSRLRVPSGKMCTHSPSARRDCSGAGMAGKARRTAARLASAHQHGSCAPGPARPSAAAAAGTEERLPWEGDPAASKARGCLQRRGLCQAGTQAPTLRTERGAQRVEHSAQRSSAAELHPPAPAACQTATGPRPAPRGAPEATRTEARYAGGEGGCSGSALGAVAPRTHLLPASSWAKESRGCYLHAHGRQRVQCPAPRRRSVDPEAHTFAARKSGASSARWMQRAKYSPLRGAS